METNEPTARDVLQWIEATLAEIDQLDDSDVQAFTEEVALSCVAMLEEAHRVLVRIVAEEAA